MAQSSGVVFPSIDGKRSTSALGRAVVHDALEPVDTVGANAAARETHWRQGYLHHFRRVVEAGLISDDAAVSIARTGLDSLHRRMRVSTPDGEVPIDEVFTQAPVDRPLESVVVRGTAPRSRELSVPFHGERLRGDALQRQLDVWTVAGSMEPSAAEAVREVVANPDWLDLAGQRVVVLGAGAEMGPLRALLSWGAALAAVDLPRPDIWRRVLEAARSSAGSLHVPVHFGSGVGDERLEERAGADLLRELPSIADWLTGLDHPLVLGNYVYADGATNVRVAMAVDTLSQELLQRRSDVALAFLATPTDVFAVPGDAVEQSVRSYRSPTAAMRLARPALRTLSGGRLLRRNYAPGSAPGINDSLVPQQGPNYALAKRLQRWRATAARQDGVAVSLKVAPPTRTRSVLKNRALAAAYAGAHRFGIEVFEPATSNTLMAALLVHDLRSGRTPEPSPWREETIGAVHGGLWRTAYDPRSALGLAVVLGMGAART